MKSYIWVKSLSMVIQAGWNRHCLARNEKYPRFEHRLISADKANRGRNMLKAPATGMHNDYRRDMPESLKTTNKSRVIIEVLQSLHGH